MESIIESADSWFLIPAPPELKEPAYSFDSYEPPLYPPELIAAAISSAPGMQRGRGRSQGPLAGEGKSLPRPTDLRPYAMSILPRRLGAGKIIWRVAMWRPTPPFVGRFSGSTTAVHFLALPSRQCRRGIEMIDYRSHLVALERFESALGAVAIADQEVADDRRQQLEDVGDHRGLAALGSLIDHLLRHAASDGQELALLERAASLWKEGLALYATLGVNRSKIESALLDPAHPDSADSSTRPSRMSACSG